MTMRRKSYNIPNHAHFLTFSCYRRQQLLTDDTIRLRLLQSWDEARQRLRVAIWSYVIMPEHVHLLIHPIQDDYQIADILRGLKEGFSRWVVAHWQKESPFHLNRITLQRGKRVVRRFWQEGGGYDRNVFGWDVIRRAVEYIEWNPVRRGLVNDPLDWQWSSAQSRAGRGNVPLAIDQFESSFQDREPCSGTRTNVRATPTGSE